MKRRELLHSRQNNGSVMLNEAHAFATRFALSLYRRRAIYSFIPKNACSTMRFTLAVDNGFLRKTDSIQWIHANNGAFVAAQPDLVTADFTFTILRCPFDRLASAYLDKIVGMHRDAWDFREEGHASGSAMDASFTDFIRTITSDRARRQNIHWRPQSEFLLYAAYDRYYAFADMPAMARDLKSTLDLDIVDARSMTGHGRGALQKLDGDYGAMPALDIALLKRDGQCPTTHALYTDETIGLVARCYREDIRLYRKRTGHPCTFTT
ncbi:sulfotransferase family 2 domain-containing protein [Sphingobium rhizovicinum]|uniref:Sulfotransferase family 2 domain-containing protein n=1 Tax=Sphingobium rhizovicinum TaxID=432308 RepID=A0ABV7NDB8_9SPHN